MHARADVLIAYTRTVTNTHTSAHVQVQTRMHTHARTQADFCRSQEIRNVFLLEIAEWFPLRR